MDGALTLFDLAQLPAPEAVETLDFETIMAAELADLRARCEAAGVEFTATVESDPAYKLLEVSSYREVIVRQRINDVARRRLLAFATGGDLDQLAAFYGVKRLVIDPGNPNATPPVAPSYEEDDDFRTRVRDRIAGSSAAGSAAWYRYFARSASGKVRDVAVDSPAGGVVRVSVLSREGNGTPSADTLAAVAAAVQAEDVRGLCSTVVVVPAEIITVDVLANIRLLPSSSQSVIDGLAASMPADFERARGLGWDVTRSWLSGRLQSTGVYDVDLVVPTVNITVAPNQCAALGIIELKNAGKAV